LEIRDYFKLIWFYRLLILLCGILGIVVAVLVGMKNPKLYQAVFSLSINQTQKEETAGYQYEGYYALQAADQIASSVMSWLPSPDVVAKIQEKAQLSPTELILSPALRVSKLGPRTLQAVWTGKSPEVLEKLAHATVEVASEKVQMSGAIPSGSVYSASIEKPVVSDITQSKKIHAVIGFFGGSLAGLILAFVIQFLTPLVRFTFEVSRIAGKDPIFVAKSGGGNEENAKRADLLRLLLDKEEGAKLVFLPIARSNFRLPAMLRDLSDSFAHLGKTVALVDGDLAMANLSSFMGLGSAEGLTEFSEGERSLSDCLQNVSEKVYCLPAGKRPANPTSEYAKLAWEKVADALGGYGAGMILAPPADATLESVRAAHCAKTIFVVELSRARVKTFEQAVALWTAKGLDFDVVVLE